MFCVGILRIFGGNRKKEENWKNRGKIRLLCRNVGNPCHGVDLRQGVGNPHRSEADMPKWHPSGTPKQRLMPQRSSATPRRSYCSQRAKFWIFVPKV